MTCLNEGFRPYRRHLTAFDAQPFLEAAEILETGGSLDQAMAVLTPQHLTSLFYVERRPPGAILSSAGKVRGAAILRQCAAELTAEAA